MVHSCFEEAAVHRICGAPRRSTRPLSESRQRRHQCHSPTQPWCCFQRERVTVPPPCCARTPPITPASRPPKAFRVEMPRTSPEFFLGNLYRVANENPAEAARSTYHDACHLHTLKGIRLQPAENPFPIRHFPAWKLAGNSRVPASLLRPRQVFTSRATRRRPTPLGAAKPNSSLRSNAERHATREGMEIPAARLQRQSATIVAHGPQKFPRRCTTIQLLTLPLRPPFLSGRHRPISTSLSFFPQVPKLSPRTPELQPTTPNIFPSGATPNDRTLRAICFPCTMFRWPQSVRVPPPVCDPAATTARKDPLPTAMLEDRRNPFFYTPSSRPSRQQFHVFEYTTSESQFSAWNSRERWLRATNRPPSADSGA